MLHQRRIKPFRGGWMLTAAVLWPSRDLRPVPHMRLPNLPVYAAVSAARAVYHPLLSAMGRCCWLSRAHRGGELFPHSKGPFCCHARWDYRGKRSHWAFPSGRGTIQRPPTEREEVAHCLLLWVFGWWRSVCLAVTSVPVAAAEQKGKAEGQISEARWWKCV